MQKNLLLFFTFLCFAFFHQSFAQQALCGFDQKHKTLLAQDAVYKQKLESFEKLYRQNLSQFGKIAITGTDTVYEIPVVIHVIHTGGAIGTAYNPADTTLIHWVDYLNQVYSATYAPYPDTSNGGVRFPYRFVFAKRDPYCNPTNGIVRVNGSVVPGYTSYGLGYQNDTVHESDIRALSNWPSNNFYNIYVVNKIDSVDGYTATSSYVAGYAYFAGANAAIDGAYMLAYVSHSGQSTLPHEMGHAMGLYHPFEGGSETTCPTNTSCTTDGDKVCDTEPSKNLLNVFPCPTNSDMNSCTGAHYNNVQYNIMGYGSCPNRFTIGQRDRALMQLLTLRKGLVNSIGGVAPSAAINGPSCIPNILAANEGNNFNMGPCAVMLNTLDYSSNGYNQDGYMAYIDNTCFQQTTLNIDSSYTLAVTTKTNPQRVKAFIDYNHNGSFETAEMIMNHNGTIASETHTATFSIPSNAVKDSILRMRVLADWTTPNPCDSLTYGQGEDFGITIIDLKVPPVADFVTNIDTICVGDTAVFTNQSSNYTTSEWHSGDGQVYHTTDLAHAYSTSGNYTVKLIVRNSALQVDSISHTITVMPKPAKPVISGDTNAIEHTAEIYTVPSHAGAAWTWLVSADSLHVSLNNSLTVNWGSPTTGKISVLETSSFGCTSDTSSVTVHVIPFVPAPVADFDIASDTICLGELAHFTNQSTSVYSSMWYTGDGSLYPSTDVDHLYMTAGTYTVKLVVKNIIMQSDSISKMIWVMPKPSTPVISGDTVVERHSTHTYNVTSHAGSVWAWTISGDSTHSGTTSNSISVSWGNQTSGKIAVMETSLYGCMSDTGSIHIRITDPVGLNDIHALSSIVIYPQPASNELWLSGDLQQVYSARLYSMEGKLVHTFGVSEVQNKNLHLDNTASGVYILQLLNENNEVLIKKKISIVRD